MPLPPPLALPSPLPPPWPCTPAGTPSPAEPHGHPPSLPAPPHSLLLPQRDRCGGATGASALLAMGHRCRETLPTLEKGGSPLPQGQQTPPPRKTQGGCCSSTCPSQLSTQAPSLCTLPPARAQLTPTGPCTCPALCCSTAPPPTCQATRGSPKEGSRDTSTDPSPAPASPHGTSTPLPLYLQHCPQPAPPSPGTFSVHGLGMEGLPPALSPAPGALPHRSQPDAQASARGGGELSG